jgi:hypothetical protein
MKRWPIAAIGLTLALAGCTAGAEHPAGAGEAPAWACRSDAVTIYLDFEGAGGTTCRIEGEGEISLLVAPEREPPINPSPWYAFRYVRNDAASPVHVTLRYLNGEHRYAPKASADGVGGWTALAVEPVGLGEGVAPSVRFALPPGGGWIAGQELVVTAQNDALLAELAGYPAARRLTIGRSHDGRAIEAIRLGRPDAPRLVVLIGRQHPPEVTGALAMRAFLEQLFRERGEADGDVQFLIVPMLNPDGVARGYWRGNMGGRDLNRDWGEFTQPETRAVRDLLTAIEAEHGIRPMLMIDFHSTQRNLFYVQGAEEPVGWPEFVGQWLTPDIADGVDYPFTVEPRNANPGSGTAKNWFFSTYGIPSLTYEVGDDADRDALNVVARRLATRLSAMLD